MDDNKNDDKKITRTYTDTVVTEKATPKRSAFVVGVAIVLIVLFFAVGGWIIYQVRGGDTSNLIEQSKDAAGSVYEKGKDAVTPGDQSPDNKPADQK